MNMNLRKVIIATVSILLLLGVGLIVVSLFVPKNKDASKSQSYESLVSLGIEAENQGDIDTALRFYKEALAKCDESNQGCRVDMNAKIDLMNRYKNSAKKKNPDTQIQEKTYSQEDLIPVDDPRKLQP